MSELEDKEAKKMARVSLRGTHILIVDDDRMVTENLQASLQMAGSNVTCAWSRTGALKAVQRRKEAYDLALIDLYLPINDGGRPAFGTGLKLAEILRKTSPKLKLIGISLFHDESIARAFRKYFATFVRKADLFADESTAKARVLEIVEGSLSKRRRRQKPKMFIVHGHDDEAKYALKNYLQNTLRLGEPIILHEQPSFGRTIIEKFEEEMKRIDIVFVILTPDDKICDAMSPEPEKLRARQNVIFEMGYFFGKLQRTSRRIMLLHKGGTELPSDLSGIIYIDISNGVDAAGEDIRREIAEWL